MTWAMFDDNWYDAPSFENLDLDSLGLWAIGNTYCNRHLTDGRIPAKIWKRFGRKGSAARTRLVQVGRWIEQQDGSFQQVGYLDHNPSKAEVELRKSMTYQAKSAAGRLGGLRSGEHRKEAKTKQLLQKIEAASEALSSPLLSNKEDPPNPPEAKPTSTQRYRAAYEKGIQSATGRPYGMPRAQEGELAQAIDVHTVQADGKKLRGEALTAWIEGASKAFAVWVSANPEEGRFYSAFGPKGWLRWLNEGRGQEFKPRPFPAQGPRPEPPSSGTRLTQEASLAPVDREVAGQALSSILGAIGKHEALQ